MEMEFEKRSPASVLLLSIFTCGLYLLYWYYVIYRDLEALTGSTPTGNTYLLDLILVLITCGIWGVYVDYKISLQIMELKKEMGMSTSDIAMPVILLDLFAYMSCWFTNYISSLIHQDELNKILDHASGHGIVRKSKAEGTEPPPPNPYS
jgi:hypothetical protein